jgi:hypothetical protein
MMKTHKLFASVRRDLAVTVSSGCVTDPNTGEKKVSRTAIGGVGGALAAACSAA